MRSFRSCQVRRAFRLIAAWLVAMAFTSLAPLTSRAEPAAPQPSQAGTEVSAADPLADMKATLASLYERQSQAAAEARSESELAAATAQLQAGKEKLAAQATEIAAKAGPSAATGELLLFVLEELPETEAAADAAKRLVNDYPQRAFRFAPSLAVSPRLWSDAFLRSLAASESLPPAQRVPAELLLAMHQRSLLFLHDEASRPFPDAAGPIERTRGAAFVAMLQSLDGDALASDTIERFEELRAEHGEKRLGGQTVADHADVSVRAVREFRLGRPAPPMIGKDLDGEPLRLEASRGKVVLLTFWASWCAPCIAEMPRERELLQRFNDKDFAILGVCLDEDVEIARKTARDAGVTWKSFADVDHSLAEEWFATQLPICAVIDRDGTLQARGVPLERAEKIVEHLLQAENAGAKEAR